MKAGGLVAALIKPWMTIVVVVFTNYSIHPPACCFLLEVDIIIERECIIKITIMWFLLLAGGGYNYNYTGAETQNIYINIL